MVLAHLVLIMSPLLLSLLGLSMGVHQNCAVWREISPCTCKTENHTKVVIICEKMQSFAEIIALLQNRFSPMVHITLKINDSKLEDLSSRSFKEMNMTIENLQLTFNELSELNPYTFAGLTHVTYLCLSDNMIPYMPIEVFEMMPNVKSLDIGRLKLKNVREESLKSFAMLETLVLAGNMIYRIDTHSFPETVVRLHLGRNSIKDLNGTLRHLNDLKWLFINSNDLVSLDDQLPKNGVDLRMLFASNNRIQKLPQELKTMPYIKMLFFQHNQLTSLDGILSKSRCLESVHLENNRISKLLRDDFLENERLKELELQFNYITSLNGSLLPLRNLYSLNLTHNLLGEFSWQEIRGLHNLKTLDVSYNKIRYLSGSMPNLIESEISLTTLKLDHNELHSLNGVLAGLRSLLRLDLSFNSITRISPDDLIGLDRLTLLDMSHNKLTTLEETSKTFLPSLEELIASHNYLTVLDKDFHGLPVLCWAYLSNNQIVSLGKDLVSKTHCRVRDGVHEDNWGVLHIDLEENPILCDSGFSEISSAMEVNHTKITGTTHCPQEEPVATRDTIYHVYEATTTSPLYNSLPDLRGYARPEQQYVHIQDQVRHNHGLKTFQQNFDGVHVRLGHDSQPIPKDQLSGGDQLTPRARSNLAVTELPLNDQPIYTNVDPVIQEQQISQLATEIEQLRTRLQELTSENQRLTRNLHDIRPPQKFSTLLLSTTKAPTDESNER
ncbi:PREDICTED: leucine-rich repeat-containing protein 15-like [Nicrophorus vespilloides]|uniref:Leucine-rich repeat-containing protein 15-like n=1 Tax=Nicrophorus vespilloides TaxID=110193 RepID=A0ABM1M3G6_NICVS|nr:PREDICTED: leucine-rich repeat-containing protein 15-like [Nicrophorus vespilloides]